MRRIFVFVLFSLLLVGCSAAEEKEASNSINETALTEKEVTFVEIYNQVVGYDDNNDAYKPIPEDAILMLDKENADDFNNEYFGARGIELSRSDSEKAELFIQIPGTETTAKGYKITSIVVKNKELLITLKEDKEILALSPALGFDGIFKRVIVADLDKEYLVVDMELAVVIE